ncbi:MAG: hypothetical protein M0R17_00520 [Candidatus Omnitrophica bacterium]|jgi:hypothetical protein|nr:hypothetical protein [Candidatus Omnitrophota bacterium]
MATFSSEILTFTNNYTDYSKISFEQITYELGRIIKLKSNNLQDFYRSSLGRRVAEIFASSLNVEWKYLEAQFREAFLLSAQNYSSIISGANSQGYSIRRPTSAKTEFRVEVNGTVSSYNGSMIFPKFGDFQYSGINYVSLDDYTFTWDYNGTVTEPDSGAELVQGTFKTRTFLADEKKKFQTFNFNDPTFSNYFGEDDLLIDDDNLENRLTTVCVDGEYYEISKYTLYTENSNTSPYIDNGVLVESRNKKCLIRTINNGNIEIRFGDGIISEIPRGTITIRYLSTLGSKGNVYNAKDSEIKYSGSESIIFQPSDSINKDNIDLFLKYSPVGGDEIESIESVKTYAPMAIASGKRYVDNDDHIVGLKTDCDNVKYAMAYGEDSIAIGDFRYSNVILYTVLKNIYVSDSSSSDLYCAEPVDYLFSGLKTIDMVRSIQDKSSSIQLDVASQFDLTYNGNELDDQEKYNYYVETFGSCFRLANQDVESGSELDSVYKVLKEKGQLTCRYLYIPPKVHKYKMSMTIYTTPIVSKTNLANTIQQEAYSYLKENSKFNDSVYNSKIVKLIEAKTGIVGCHVYFEPYADIPNDSVYISTLTSASYDIFNGIMIPTMDNIVSNYYTPISNSTLFSGLGSDYSNYSYYLQKYFCKGSSTTFDSSKMTETNVSNFIEYIFKETLGRLLLNTQLSNTPSNLTEILLNSNFNNPDTSENIYTTFVNWAVQFRKDTNYYCAKQLITDKGDIANFSIPHEIAQIHISVDDITITSKNT